MNCESAMAAATQPKKDRHMVSWTQEEDDLLREQVAVHGSDNWTIIAAQFKDKTGRQCRRRWLTHLNTDCKKGGWSQEEDMLLCEAQKLFGNRWTEIAKVVSGRTDNAVKNRFSTLCKKRAKYQTVSKENNDSFVHHSNKKIMVDSSAINQQIRYGAGSNYADNFNSHEKLASTYAVGVQKTPPLADLTKNFNNLSCFRAQSQLHGKKPAECDAITNCEVRHTFLRRDDPKLTALLQQAELLSSLAVKAYSENKNQSLEDAWKELQNYLIRTREGVTLKGSSEIDFLLDNFEVLKDFQCVDSEIQQARRDADREESQNSSEISTGCTNDDPAKNIRKHQHKGTQVPITLECQGGVVSSYLELAQNSENLSVSSKLEFVSPLKTIPLFHSFTEEIPSPMFSSSERKFLLTVLGASSSKPISNTNQTPCEIDPPHPNSNQPHSCKRVLLNSL